MKTARFKAGALALASVLTLAACSSGTESSSTSAESSNDTVRMWVMEGSFSDESRATLEEEFAAENPGSELKIEVQQWEGIISKLQTALASDKESPDLVEIGNTQTTTFTTVGAFAPVTDMVAELGGDDLIPSFVEASTVDGEVYALPLYAGARGVFYRKDLFEQAGIQVPQTIDEFNKAVIDLQAANPAQTPEFSGAYLAAVDQHGINSFLFANGFNYADEENGKWVGKVNTPESIAALEKLQEVFQHGTTYALDSQTSQKNFERLFNQDKVGVLIGTGNIGVKLDQAKWDADQIGVFALPSDKPGVPGKTFAGGSNIAIASKAPNPEGAQKALKVIFSEKFQKTIAEKEGWIPGNTSYGVGAEGPFGELAAEIVANSKLTPNSPEWAVSYDAGQLTEFFGKIAKGGDVKALAEELNTEMENTLNK